jgi:hypothetical protein
MPKLTQKFNYGTTTLRSTATMRNTHGMDSYGLPSTSVLAQHTAQRTNAKTARLHPHGK